MILWDWSEHPSIQRKYQDWLDTPDGQTVYRAVRDAALRLRRRGFRHYGMKALFEAARFSYSLRVGPDADGFKLNNNWTSRLARDLMEAYPEIADFFETRELRA